MPGRFPSHYRTVKRLPMRISDDIPPQRPGLIYHETRFRLPRPVASWPAHFGLITGYATTGEIWPEERNQKANAKLEQQLSASGCWMTPVTGYSPTTGHAEPG